MDDNNNADDVRQSLYEEFLSEVVKAGNPEAFFDETDLIEIYDYSSDMDNYIAKMEVLPPSSTAASATAVCSTNCSSCAPTAPQTVPRHAADWTG